MSVTTLGGLIRGSNYVPMSREEYAATTRPSAYNKPAFAKDSVEISPFADFLSRFGKFDISKTLVKSITPNSDALGLASGLYAGVGQLPAWKVQSLISEHV